MAGQPGGAAGQPPQQQPPGHHQQDRGHQQQIRRPDQPERAREQLIEVIAGGAGLAVEEHGDRRRPEPQIRRDQHGQRPGARGQHRAHRPAGGEGDPQAEQDESDLYVGRHPDQGARRQAGQHAGLAARLPPAHQGRADQGQGQEAHGRRDRVHVPGGDQPPQQQRVERPEHVRPHPGRRIGAQQPVQRQHHQGEGQRVPHLQPERDPRRRCPAENGRRALLDRRQRPVERMLGLPGDGGGRADGVAAQPELLGGHDVRVVADRHHPPVGGVVEGVGGPGGREHRQHRGGGQRRHHQHLDRWPPPPPGRHQAGRHPAGAGQRRHPQRDRHQPRRRMQGDPPRRPRPGPGRLTTALLGPAAETTIMISSEDPMQARATRPRRLPPPGPAPPPGPVPVGRGQRAGCRRAGCQRAALPLPGAPGARPWPRLAR